MKFDLLVFDWDGTLMDSEARIVASMSAAFADLGLQPPPPAQARDVIGLGLEQAIRRLWPESAPTQRLDLIQRYRHHFLEANDTPTPLFEQAAEVVTELHAAGYLLAVATGKSRRGLDSALRQTGLDAVFHATRCADETFSKPHPQMLLELLDELGTDAGRCLMIGDTEYDLQMARNAGVAALGVSYGVHAPERLLALEPLGCLSAIAELPQWLGQGARPEHPSSVTGALEVASA
ncbi:HAD-IA family hydrolase [Thiohalocapsa marina]|uniref:HAD-IA family hydrolase n=2 Tax=Thiohalocapsa marina TaxID=424902 RepID=A0A5M8FRX7_9GAMM|nr:HAD-IA family hydrolase [Thiohalocapsa marina]KAA6185885.1 HAD-IA family hydrolase [Thiohalocapsa marina]